METKDDGVMRTFPGGAMRDTTIGKIDPEGYLSPFVLLRFSEYMNAKRVQSDGQLRDSDNWQKGIPRAAYMKSLWRHFLEVWTEHRLYLLDPEAWAKDGGNAALEEMLCALLFNIQGYLHELLTRRDVGREDAFAPMREEEAEPLPDERLEAPAAVCTPLSPATEMLLQRAERLAW